MVLAGMVPTGGVRVVGGVALTPPDAPVARVTESVGLFQRQGTPSDTSTQPGWSGLSILGGYVKGMVVNAYWNDFQPTATTDSVPATNAISTAIAFATANGLQLKVRLFAGVHAPGWAKALSGGSVTMFEPQSSVFFECPRFWHPDYIAAFGAFMAKIKEAYGLDPAIDEWAITGPMTYYAEPMLTQTATQADPVKNTETANNRARLIAAGYTIAAHDTAFRQCIDMHTGLRGVSALACNALQQVNSDGTFTKSSAKTVSLMTYARTVLGGRGGVGNNSLRHSPPNWDAVNDVWPGEYATIYTQIKTMGHPSYIQTAQPTLVGNLYEACKASARMGVTMIELPGGTSSYTSTGTAAGLSPAQFDEINGLLAANAAL